MKALEEELFMENFRLVQWSKVTIGYHLGGEAFQVEHSEMSLL